MATVDQQKMILREMKQVVRQADDAFASLANLGRKAAHLDLAASLTDDVCDGEGLVKADVIAFFAGFANLAPVVDQAQPLFHKVL